MESKIRVESKGAGKKSSTKEAGTQMPQQPDFEKPKEPNEPNGFTLLEALLVMLVVGILVGLSIPNRMEMPLSLFMEQRVLEIEGLQMKAYVQKQNQSFAFLETGMESNGKFEPYPKSVSCKPAIIRFNAMGNVDMAGQTQCFNKNGAYRLVWQLGSGRIRYEPL